MMLEDDAKKVLGGIADHQRAVNPVKVGDYHNVRDRGLLYCGECHTPKECIVAMDGEQRTVPCLCECRKRELAAQERRMMDEEQKRLVASLKKASLMSGKFKDATFERFYKRPENEKQFNIARRYVDNFEDMFRTNTGLLLYGPVGSGKSYTAACIANAVMEEGTAVVMTSFVKLLQDFWKNDQAEWQFGKILETVPLVIIDDFGAERSTEYTLEKVYNIVDSRVRACRPLILTTNLDMEDMKRETEIRRKRIYDRVLMACYPVKFSGRSFREMVAGARQKKAKEILEGNDDGRE